jgi:hypothetical protein
VDRAPFVLLATMEAEHFPIGTGEARGHEFEIRIVLRRDAVATNTGPTIRSWALRSHPATQQTEQITVPLLIAPKIQRRDGVTEEIDPAVQVDNISTLVNTKEVVSYTEGDRGWSVIVADYQFDVHDVWVGSDTGLGVAGTCIVRMKSVI